MTDKIRKGFLAIAFVFIIFGFMHSQNVYAEDMMGHPVMENVLDIPEINEGEDSTLPRYGASYPRRYDPRESGKVTSIKDQGSYNTCWAFSIISSIESNLIKKGIADNTIDLSENHLTYYFYNRKADSLKYTNNDKNTAVRDKWYNNGGTLMGASIALTTWSGITTENASKYLSVPGKNICYKHDYVVKNVYRYNYSVNTIKQAVKKYGAVATGMYMVDEYYNAGNGAYYCNKDDGNHAVSIVGWDDDYSRNNFNSSCRPGSDGAWIAKNSYGRSFGDNGYIYISYEDKSLDELMAYDVIKEKDSYDNNYQHDGSASCVYTYRFNNGTKAANIFTAKAAGKYNEILKAVSVNTYTTNVKYSLQIYTGLTDSSDPESGTAMFSKPQTGTMKEAGYNQITLKKPVTLAAGEKFSVVFKFSSSDNEVKIGIDKTYNASWVKFQAYAGSKRSFVNLGYRWTDSGASAGAILRIKAYTDNTKTVPSYKISRKKMSLTAGKSVKLSVTARPSSVKRSIKWSSSNKKVAQVSSNGTVKAKSKGTAEIKAKFIAGGSVKVFKCKVTVKPLKKK